MKTAREFINEELKDVIHVNALEEDEVNEIEACLIKFAKLHVKQALEVASNIANLNRQSGYGTYEQPSSIDIEQTNLYAKNSYGHGDCSYDKITVNKNSILNSYSETLVK